MNPLSVCFIIAVAVLESSATCAQNAPATQPSAPQQTRAQSQQSPIQNSTPAKPNQHSAAAGQSSSGGAKHPGGQSRVTETRPDAVYSHPSGQDSHPTGAPTTTKFPDAAAARGTGTVENRGSKAANQSKDVKQLSAQKAYTGNSGSKQDPGTACSTARPTKDGGVDCGTSGNGATLGKIVTKPR